MSLFGGSAPPSRSSYESDASSLSSSARSLPSVEEISDPRDAQQAQKLEIPTSLDIGDDLDTDSESARDDIDDDEPVRPNRFLGRPQAWRSYTQADRQIVESLAQIQDTDLAAHLYNAHALKRRIRRPEEDTAQLKNWQNRDTWRKTGNDLEYTDAAGFVQTAIAPSKDWTAWPLPPAPPSDSDDQLSDGMADGQAHKWPSAGASTQDVADELREELQAVFLRLAKERWNSREAASPESDAGDPKTASHSTSRSQHANRARSHSTSAAPLTPGNGDDAQNNSNDDGRDHTTGKKRGRKPRTERLTEPTMLADDARAQRLLRPTIQTMMGELDELALAIHRTRANHFGRGGSADSSISEFTSGVESRSTSRARSKSVTSRRSSTRPPSRAKSTRAARTARPGTKTARDGREPVDSEATSSGVSDWETSNNMTRERKRRRSSSSISSSNVSETQDMQLREGLMDWSEVLGLAAVQGWDREAVARTAQRCAALFGESMSFMSLHEALALKPATEPVLYTPSVIPSPTITSISQPLTPKRPFFLTGTLRCPHAGCYGHEKDFALPYRVIEHCMRVHGYDPRTNDSDNEERTVGGVHIDGFLQPVTMKPGWLGNGRSKAGRANKKQRKGQSGSRAASEAVVSTGE
ncbi:N-terminal acetyltransferase B complex catalytic subunit [Alternaria panax]|uniref:N-terminal acetyltransferase B complex catalytic subunit n=1 Tax=Alternaria panax TaxID=48097 RepID=A0AAD4I820_9PLEO|nr:N-terminal acetyltransferase B complex catalytic subunit [Alternaria panax]